VPELPEVETVRRQLAKEIIGEEIVGIEVRQEKCFAGKRNVVKEEIVGVNRVGKYLFVEFVSGRGLAIHLKMTGRLVIDNKWYETAGHTRVVVRLASGRSLYYWDTRMFGYVRVVERIGEEIERVKNKLGSEPWKIGEGEFLAKLQKTSRKVKDVLLDQSLLAGVGNIYANDSLHVAGISPLRPARSLRVSEVGKMLVAIREVMERGLKAGGASDNSYLDAYGKKGRYQDEFVVYGKTRGQCPSCGRELKYLKVSGRGTWYCDYCQT